MKGPVFATMITAAAAIYPVGSSSSSSHVSSSSHAASSVQHSSSSHSTSLGPKQTNAPNPFELKVLADKNTEADLKDCFAGEMSVRNPALNGKPMQPADRPVALVKPHHHKSHSSTKASSTGKHSSTSTKSAHTSSKASGKPEPTGETSKVLRFELVNGELEVHTSEKHEGGKEPAKTYVSFGKQNAENGMVAVELGGAPASGFHLKELPKSLQHTSTSSVHKPTTTMVRMPKSTGLTKKHHVACHNETGHEGVFYACPINKPVTLPTGTGKSSSSSAKATSTGKSTSTGKPTNTGYPTVHSKRQELELSAPTHVPAPIKDHNLFVHFGNKAPAKDCQEIKLEVFRGEHKSHTKTSSAGAGYPTHHSSSSSHSSSSHASVPTAHSSASSAGSAYPSKPAGGYPTHEESQ